MVISEEVLLLYNEKNLIEDDFIVESAILLG